MNPNETSFSSICSPQADYLEDMRYNETQIKNEPMLFNCDFDHAIKLGGELTKKVLQPFLDERIAGYLDLNKCVIDTRVHMLMPGWYPCIPGWHHDDVPRTREDGQPNYHDLKRSLHYILLLNASVAPTEFALSEVFGDPIKLYIPEKGRVIYSEWDRTVDELIKINKLKVRKLEDKRWVMMDDRTFHRGVPAVKNGWRYFIRLSAYFEDGKQIERGNPRTNEIRRNAQVYMSALNAGW